MVEILGFRFGIYILGSGFRVWGLRFWFRILILAFRVEGEGFRARGISRVEVEGEGFRVWGMGLP